MTWSFHPFCCWYVTRVGAVRSLSKTRAAQSCQKTNKISPMDWPSLRQDRLTSISQTPQRVRVFIWNKANFKNERNETKKATTESVSQFLFRSSSFHPHVIIVPIFLILLKAEGRKMMFSHRLVATRSSTNSMSSNKFYSRLAPYLARRSLSIAATTTTTADHRVLVVGSGVIGLRTAVELTRRDIPVVLRSPVHPLHPSNCSQGAGGLWMPFHCDDPRTDRWSMETLDEIYPMAQDANDSLVSMEYVVSLKRDHHGPQTIDFIADNYDRGTGGKSGLPTWSTDARLQFQNVTLEQVAWQNQVLKLRLPPLHIAQDAGYEHAWMFQTPIVDSPKMLTHMLDEIKLHSESDVDVENGVYYESLDEIAEEAQNLGCDTIVNATGLGARSICDDSQLVGGRGILLQFDRETCIRSKPATQEELTSAAGPNMLPVDQQQDCCVMVEDEPWGSNEFPCYMIARGDTLVVGGTYLEGDTKTSIRPAEKERLLENARIMGIETSPTIQKPKDEWVGFRPYRPETRVETEELKTSNGQTVRVVHAYGTGGSGWTVYTGVAKDAVQLITS